MLHRYDQTLSDISGMDIETHGNESGRVIGAVRDWLNSGRGDWPPLPKSTAIIAAYAKLENTARGSSLVSGLTGSTCCRLQTFSTS